jgi:hypothetical protein
MRRANDATLIVDGAITADKLTANHLNAVNTESGTFQQAYTAPGDDNSTPGAGLKITGGNIEAYGASQTFGGTIISSDGNYMVSIGKALTATGQGKRYPLNNGTNFSVDGKIHLYYWASSTWTEYAAFGGTSGYTTNRMTILNRVDAEVAISGYDLSTSSPGTGLGVRGYSSQGYGGSMQGAISPLILQASASASAPSHSAGKGSLWVTSGGVLYINTDGGTTWAKVGAQ